MKSNKLTIYLLGKHPSNNTYKVKIGSRVLWLSRQELMREIRATPSKDRNCIIRDGNITMKPGFGSMVVINTPNSATKHGKRVKATVKKPSGPVQIVTRMPHKNSENSIYMVDGYFANHIADKFDFLNRSFNILKKVDGVKELIQSVDIKVETPFGLTDINHISTGCKCLLCAKYLISAGKAGSVVLNTDEAGDAVFLALCKLAAGTELRLYASVYRDGFEVTDAGISVLIDGKPMEDPTDLIFKIGDATEG